MFDDTHATLFAFAQTFSSRHHLGTGNAAPHAKPPPETHGTLCHDVLTRLFFATTSVTNQSRQKTLVARVTLNTTLCPIRTRRDCQTQHIEKSKISKRWLRKEWFCRAPTCLLHAQYDTQQREPILSFKEATTFVTHGWIAGVSLGSTLSYPRFLATRQFLFGLCQSNTR